MHTILPQGTALPWLPFPVDIHVLTQRATIEVIVQRIVHSDHTPFYCDTSVLNKPLLAIFFSVNMILVKGSHDIMTLGLHP